MKYSTISLLLASSTAKLTRKHPKVQGNSETEDRVSIMGYDEGDFYNFIEGWATGWFHRDMRDDWGDCIEYMPELMLDFATPTGAREGLGTLMHPIQSLKKMGDISEIGEIAQLGNWFQHTFDEAESAPRQLMECSMVWEDLRDSTTHFSAAQDTLVNFSSEFFSHPYVHTIEGFGLIGKIYGSIYNHDLYDCGKSISEVMFSVFGNEELLDYLLRVKEMKKEEKIEREMRIARDKLIAAQELQMLKDSFDTSAEGRRKYELELEKTHPEMREARLKNEAIIAEQHEIDLRHEAEWAAEAQRQQEERDAIEAQKVRDELQMERENVGWASWRFSHEGPKSQALDLQHHWYYQYCEFRGDCPEGVDIDPKETQ